jgi:two-component system alkaline phosphatase synthesis response regulator PhoP
MPPHSAREIMMRINLLQGSNEKDTNITMELGELKINTLTYEVYVNNKKVNLTFKEYELLKFLASKPGQVFSRESLLHSVWNYDYYGGTRTVDVHIRRLRSKINDMQNQFIETIWNVGYRFRLRNQ